ncbi:MAG: SusF/SusE family outer membrane protein [Bacteroidetes bacterium]|nr:SusF/SusE family outer membrane protein [Bacteroidota bacterium]
MKRKIFSKILTVLVLATLVFVSCTKENSEVRLDPTLATSQVYGVTHDSATVVGFVVASGSGFSERGVCYNTSTSPTVDNSKVVYTGESRTATFVVDLGGLNYATTYYVRAYATNASGTIYGDEYSFTTDPIAPSVSTAEIKDITGTTATGGGTITNTGGAAITARGICYSTSENPTVADHKTSDGTGDGAFVSSMSSLLGLTDYHVRAYATNSAGTSYGEDVKFTTLVSVRTWNVPGDYVGDSYPGTTLANWDPANSPQVKSNLAAPNSLEGYVYMANATNQWKLATQTNWNGPNYGAGATGVLDPNGGNFQSPAGYYKINADAINLTYTAVATVWGVIGSATANGWNDETGLTYVPAMRTWRGGIHLAAGEFKFRANHDWGLNYGSTAGNATLDAGGSNIPAPSVESDYYFALDLSTPLTYTYTADRWGIIGDATAGGWSDDQNMTWDATNQVLTATIPLTVGAIKFRANDDWAVNYGGPLTALTQGGDNIPIAEAGTYVITLDLGKVVPSCTITKQKK